MNACVFVLLCLALANLGFSSYKRWNVVLDYELAASFLLEKNMWRVESEMKGLVLCGGVGVVVRVNILWVSKMLAVIS
jgi:hypothetical protein